jgi:hypothetical protein
MRGVFAGLCLVVALPLFAERKLDLRIVDTGDGARVRALPKVQKALKHYREGVGASAIYDNRATRLVLIPVIGNAVTGRGEHFKSDITFVNYNVDDQRVEMIYMPSGNPGGTVVLRGPLPGDVPPFTIADFVGTEIEDRIGTIGALLILPIDANDDFDPNGAIDAHSRIHTPIPAMPQASVSMQFPGVDPSHLQGEYEAINLGLRQDADFRTNVGIVNLEDFPIEFVATMFPENGTQFSESTITVQGLAMIQQGLPNPTIGPFNLIVSVNQDIPGDNQWWSTYAASVDNISGDGWVSIASVMLDDEDLDDRGQ